MCCNKHGKIYLLDLKQLKALGHITYAHYTNYTAIFIGLIMLIFFQITQSPSEPENTTQATTHHSCWTECFITAETKRLKHLNLIHFQLPLSLKPAPLFYVRLSAW